MNLKHLVGFPLVAVALVTTRSIASEPAGYGELGFDVGFADMDSRVADESGGRLAFRGGYQFTPVLGFEGQLFALNADGIAGSFVTGSDDVTIGAGMMNLTFSMPTKSSVAPYLLVGAGRANTEFDPGLFENEAFVKALGHGLYHPLDNFDVSLLPGEPGRIIRVERPTANIAAGSFAVSCHVPATSWQLSSKSRNG